MKFKGAIFDMDGTIVDSLMYWDCLWKRIGEKYMGDASFKPTDELSKSIRTMIFSDAMAYLREYYSIPESAEAFLQFTYGDLKDFYKNTVTVKDGARELLSYLKKNGIPLCLASATAMPEVQYALQCHDLLKYFDLVLSCADIGVGKDRPDIYLMAAERMGLPPADICVVEDSFIALETAKGAGFQAVGVYDRYSAEQERLQRASDLYLNQSQTLAVLIDFIE